MKKLLKLFILCSTLVFVFSFNTIFASVTENTETNSGQLYSYSSYGVDYFEDVSEDEASVTQESESEHEFFIQEEFVEEMNADSDEAQSDTEISYDDIYGEIVSEDDSYVSSVDESDNIEAIDEEDGNKSDEEGSTSSNDDGFSGIITGFVVMVLLLIGLGVSYFLVKKNRDME